MFGEPRWGRTNDHLIKSSLWTQWAMLMLLYLLDCKVFIIPSITQFYTLLDSDS